MGKYITYIYILFEYMNNNYINKSKNGFIPDIYMMTKVLLVDKKGSCLSLGPGAGLAELDLIKNGWHVTAVDINPYSYKVMRKLTKSKKLEFINVNFAKLTLTKKYDYIIASHSIPFIKKKQFIKLFDNIVVNHSNKKCIYSMTFFQNTHTFVKKGKSFGITMINIKKLFNKYKIKIILMEQNQINRKEDNIMFNYINVIGQL
jgi:SAM-dependent methyltransferase